MRDAANEIPWDSQGFLYERALLGMSTVHESDRALEVPERDRWLPYLVQSGAYHSTEPLLEAIARYFALFVQIGQGDELRHHPDYVPITEWFSEDYGGLSIERQFAAAIAILGVSNVIDDDVPINARADLDRNFISRIALQLGVDVSALEDVLVGDRDWYRDAFERAALKPDHARWNTAPFEQRPVLRRSSGDLLVTSPRALVSWMTDGFYFRALDAARRRGMASRFLRFSGALVERYAVELVTEAQQNATRAGVGRVVGDSEQNGRRTPDIAIDYGPDLVLMEVVAKRLTFGSRVTGDAEQVVKDLRAMLVKKARQLSDRVDDLVAGRLSIPGTDMHSVQRIWPVLVFPGGLLQTPMLWDFLLEALEGGLQQARMQKLTLLDLSDLESMAGLIEQGFDPVWLLRRKTEGPYATLDWSRFVHEDPHLPTASRFSGLERRTDLLWEQVVRAAGLDLGEYRRVAAEAEPSFTARAGRRGRSRPSGATRPGRAAAPHAPR